MPEVPNPAASRRPLVLSRSRPRRRSGALLGAVLTLGLLGTSGAAGAAASAPPTAASGTLASLSGTSIEVQNPSSGQVTVTWTPTTTFRQTVNVPASTLAVGDCITATGAAPTAKAKKPAKSGTTSITATTVSIGQPSATGTCSVGTTGGGFVIGGGGFGGAGGFAGRGFRGTGGGGTGAGGSGSFRPPSGTFPKGGAGRAAAFGNVAFGKVTSLSGNVLVVVGARPTFTAPPKGTSSTKGKTKTTPTKPKLVTTKSKVTFTTTTTFNETMSSSSTALAVGQCVTALGPASDTGAITATSISVRPAGPSGCFTFTGGAGFGRGGPGAGAGTTTA
jgi:uncharacterized protein DUF5666